jgi:hypothetical protein
LCPHIIPGASCRTIHRPATPASPADQRSNTKRSGTALPVSFTARKRPPAAQRRAAPRWQIDRHPSAEKTPRTFSGRQHFFRASFFPARRKRTRSPDQRAYDGAMQAIDPPCTLAQPLSSCERAGLATRHEVSLAWRDAQQGPKIAVPRFAARKPWPAGRAGAKILRLGDWKDPTVVLYSRPVSWGQYSKYGRWSHHANEMLWGKAVVVRPLVRGTVSWCRGEGFSPVGIRH